MRNLIFLFLEGFLSEMIRAIIISILFFNILSQVWTVQIQSGYDLQKRMMASKSFMNPEFLATYYNIKLYLKKRLQALKQKQKTIRLIDNYEDKAWMYRFG